MLPEAFTRTIREREATSGEESQQRLEQWMTKTENLAYPNRGFRDQGVRQNLDAVLAVPTSPYSQRQTEDRVNKLIERSM